jgi:Hemerythrin HHE cation binding domain
MPNLFDVLRFDHQEVERMLAELESGPTAAAGASGDDLLLRKKMVEQLVIEESKHEALEEMYVWPAVRDQVADGDRLADIATGQEQQAKEVLDRLDKLAAGDPEFEQLVTAFIAAGREHISYEESEVWPLLWVSLTPEEAHDLGVKFAEGKQTAPTRPHPRTPAAPGVLKTAGQVVAAADRARDAVSGRGE